MEPDRFARLRRIVEEALELDRGEREAFLIKECPDDPELLKNARDLLSHEGTRGSSLTGALEGHVREAAAQAIDEEALTEIGDYTIVSKLGEGGMGVVYRAEQTGALQRTVALKLIRTGWNSRQVVARFESERLALARMNHPNIARVFDAGTTTDGRPWFVMELVEGRHLVEWCDENLLSPRRRLDLFLAVCRGVQHAHRKGIIHRDLKPSNILVSGGADNPTVKIIDFGIAKALTEADDQLSGMTVAGQQLGSPDYMSPERLEGDVDDPDVRSDIFSLGVILFELLSGRIPHDRSSKSRLATTNTRAEPPSLASKPGSDAARARGTDPAALRRFLKGELDWVVAKAMAPDREKRYDNARELIQDIERHLAGEPVQAGQPGLPYRIGKYLKRHRTPITMTLIVVTALAIGLVESLRQKQAADTARDEAEAVTEFLSDMLASASPQEKGREVTVREVLDEAAGQVADDFGDRPRVRARLQSTIGNTYLALGEADEAIRLHEETVALRRAENGDESVETLMALCDLGHAVSQAGQSQRAEEIYAEALAGLERHSGEDVERVLFAVNGLANALADQGRLTEAEAYYLDALEKSRTMLGPDDPLTTSLMNNLALLRYDQGDVEQAAEILAEVLELRRNSLGENHPHTMESVINLAGILSQLGKLDATIEALEPLVPRARQELGDSHRITLSAMNNLAWAYARTDRLAEAEDMTRQTWEIRRREMGEDHFETMISAHNMADLYRRLGRLDEAEALHRQNLENRIRVLGEDHPHVGYSREGLAEVHEEMGREKEAADLREQAGGG